MTGCFRQERVKAARIMVVGCGALGNEVLKNLVLMGAGHLVIVDFDVVERSNLTRSILFIEEDARVKRRKVDVAAERLKAINPTLEIQTICGDIAYDVGLGLVREMDVVIGCVDSRWARFVINRLCMRAGVPWVDGGIEGLEGTARVFRPGCNCYACNLGPEGHRDLARRMPCSGIIRRQELAGSAPTTSVIASIIGAVEVQEALKLIHREELESGQLTSLCGRMLSYEGEHLTTHVARFQAWDDDCPEHDCWHPVSNTVLTCEMTVEETLGCLQQELGARDVSVRLSNDCFVDYVTLRSNDSRRMVMLPGRAVEGWIAADKELSGIPLSGFYQHEYRFIDSSFPYQQLTLGELGIPPRDVLHVMADGKDCYLELKGKRE